jgi:hypothetical protein
MGDVVRPDRALSHSLMVVFMELLEKDWETACERDRLALALEGAFYILAYTLALRGEEVPLIHLRGIKKHW